MPAKDSSDSLFSRRDSLRLLGAAGAAAWAGWNTANILAAGVETLLDAPEMNGALYSPEPHLFTGDASALSCVVKPAQTEGPYFVDEKLNRSDIRLDPANKSLKEGVPLRLKINVNRVKGDACAPLTGAQVDIWQCDALGSYSDVRDTSGRFDTRGQKFLRGYQVTNPDGTAEFLTIYPGWYTGRAVHIHFKIRLFTGDQKALEFTSQLYFEEAMTDQVHALAPYKTKGKRDRLNERDSIFRQGGDQLLLNVKQDGAGYVGTFDIGLK